MERRAVQEKIGGVIPFSDWLLKKNFQGGAHTRRGVEKFGIRTLMVFVTIASHRKKCILCHFFPFVGIPLQMFLREPSPKTNYPQSSRL